MFPIWTFSLKQLRRPLMIALIALIAVSVLWAERPSLTASNTSGGEPVYSVQTSSLSLALTFDITWGDHVVTDVLSALQSQGIAQATFFVSGEWAEAHPQQVQAILAAGYELGSEGYTYRSYTKLSEDQAAAEIEKGVETLTALTGQHPKLFRFPNGAYNPTLLRLVRAQGLTAIQWDADTQDWKKPQPRTIATAVAKQTHPGAIFLLHASDSATGTAEAIRLFAPVLKDEGYRCVSVSQLLQLQAGQNVPTLGANH
ncbi:MAG: polysaccharide deacetylase family protein [Firmicutes bacterium]|nr:polysaccharide deacetylase family protein [Bacillota bacterium]